MFRSVGMRECYEAQVNGSESPPLSIRPAGRADAERVAEIYNEGVEDRVATFETREATASDATTWIEEDIVVIAAGGDEVAGWAKAGPYTDRHRYYDGVREATIFVARGWRRTGVGRLLVSALEEAASAGGAYKLVGKIFTSNHPSIALVKELGWREVGVHERHGTLDGEWKDVLVVEKLL